MGARQHTEDQLYWLAGGRVKTSRREGWSRFRCVVQPSTQPRVSRFDKDHPHYRWVALSNTTLGVLMATINSSIVIISLPAIFRGIDLNPLEPGNVSYLLWIIMGFLVVSAVLVVTLGRLGDMFGRVKMYNLGFLVFSVVLRAALGRPVHGWLRGDVADRHAHRPGRGRSDAVRQLHRDPHRRLPRRAAGHGARHQPGLRHRRLLPRAGHRRAALGVALARGVLGERADRHHRHGVGLQVPRRARGATQGAGSTYPAT